MAETELSEAASEVIDRILVFRDEWLSSPKPNTSIKNFDEAHRQITSAESLAGCNAAHAVSFAEGTLQDLAFPEPDGQDADHSFLLLHWKVTRFQQLLFELLSTTSYANDSPAASLEKDRYAKEIGQISDKIDILTAEIKQIRATKKFGGMSISILGISTPIETIWKAIKGIRLLLQGEGGRVDADKLTASVETIYSESKSIWQTISSLPANAARGAANVAQTIVYQAGSALSQVLGLGKQVRHSAAATMSVALNGNLEIAELREIRDEFDSVGVSTVREGGYPDIYSYIRRFEYGLSIKEDAMDLILAEYYTHNLGSVLVVSVTHPPQKRRELILTRSNYCAKIVSFFDYVISNAERYNDFRVDMSKYEPVLSVSKNKNTSFEIDDF
jgi:hypothetical protein